MPYLDGVTLGAARGLFTPSGAPDGAFVTGTLPPLAVTRRLSFGDAVVGNHSECFDAWVATWEPAR